MGKRSNFPHRNDYDTPVQAIPALIPHLIAEKVRTFAEPCCGNGMLVGHLEAAGFKCVHMDDIKRGGDALHTPEHVFEFADAIVTNPPWDRELLHPLIARLMRIKPTWLLFEADWAHTIQGGEYLPHCSKIVSVGRLRWIPGSKYTGKDNASWYRFDHRHRSGPRFYGRDRSFRIEKIIAEAAE